MSDNVIVSNSYISSNPDIPVETTSVNSKHVQHATLQTVQTFRQDAVSATVSYFGFALAGSATSAATWRIFKLDTTTSSDQKLLFADGNPQYDNIWDNRAALSYS